MEVLLIIILVLFIIILSKLKSLTKHVKLLENKIGTDPEKLQPLLDAWNDWVDRDDFERVNGAEKKYY